MTVVPFDVERSHSVQQHVWGGCTVIWATNQLGDSHLGDNFWTTGRHHVGSSGVVHHLGQILTHLHNSFTAAVTTEFATSNYYNVKIAHRIYSNRPLCALIAFGAYQYKC